MFQKQVVVMIGQVVAVVVEQVVLSCRQRLVLVKYAKNAVWGRQAPMGQSVKAMWKQ